MRTNEMKDNNKESTKIKGKNEIMQKIESLEIDKLNITNDDKKEEYLIKVWPFSNICSNNSNLFKSICKIQIESLSDTILGTGFLFKFVIAQENFYCLVSNENILKKDIINNNYIIHFFYNYEVKSNNSKKNERKRYIKSFIDIGLDITIIEILEEDNIPKDYFLWNEVETNNDRLINSQIFIPELIQETKIINLKGKIIKINNYEFTHSISTSHDSSGYPIFISYSGYPIGIQKNKNGDKSENYGDFIYPIINIITKDIFNIRNCGKYINGKYIYEDGKYYIGQYKDNKPNGKGKKYYSNGNILYEGDFCNGKFDGNGKYYYDDGKYFIGGYKNGLRNGKGIKYYKNGNIEFEGEFIDGEPEGFGKNYWEDGESYVGQCKAGLKHGKGIEYYSNGKIQYEGDFIHHKRDGIGKYFWDDGKYYIGQWKNDKRNGKGTNFYPNGKIQYEGDFIDDDYGGNGKYIWENGEYYIGQWKNGLRNGKGILYYSNGNIQYEGDYLNDKRDGLGKYIMANEDYYIGQWKNGSVNGKGIIYYKNGKISCKGNFVNGNINGIFTKMVNIILANVRMIINMEKEHYIIQMEI